ncbi:hypothetical protein [Enterococcus faecalis]|uniref:hypothetical protein n=1 Tax=Enterococcus faecalis TaxID=1351 RepID=UPI001923D74A|nr:hypothetical protein [Enterococcus faecalis]EGO7928980.1 hypothetical protein [Enterococcus faecalis]EHB5062863.1 hypothetical protein [Enterococcus faecalis]EHZ5706994.1 hypothetical protein [Enterococcus faecalis]EKG8969835.1 hypothetical protein [Enterococcus faecalis]
MSKLELAKRKVNLQRLQLKSLSDAKNTERYKEQRKVLFMLALSPLVLFTSKRMDTQYNSLYKYANTLTASAKDDELYNATLEMYQEA